MVYEDIISSTVGCNGEFNKPHQQDLSRVNPSSAGIQPSRLVQAALVGMGRGASGQRCLARTETAIPTSIPSPGQNTAFRTPRVSHGLQKGPGLCLWFHLRHLSELHPAHHEHRASWFRATQPAGRRKYNKRLMGQDTDRVGSPTNHGLRLKTGLTQEKKHKFI